ncbi:MULTISPECIES: hypothetical protein [Corynebacterium]|uniref:hypothetical protein n=1 Tax=Corynebacterium TaxID=1716 RepID=UPI0012EBDDA5|nr:MULTISPECIES: hypothetical protein [Corynebacterium]MDK4288353.1 hypothetical protein [Corynebacterium pseudodiphtheriticum]
MILIIRIEESSLSHVKRFSTQNSFGCGCLGIVFRWCGFSRCCGARASRACVIDRYSGEDFGGVSIPRHYEYWGCHKPWKYMQWDNWARHDYCMDTADLKGTSYKGCHVDLFSNMNKVCNANYDGAPIRKYDCQTARDVYFIAVDTKN